LQVMIRFCDGVEFQGLCEQFTGRRGDFVQDFVMATAPGTGDTVCIYSVPDDSALATWIHLRHPEWIDYVWTARNRAAQIWDPEDTFLQLVAEDLDDKRKLTNTTP
jgi:hypothetical protein